jgi:acyl carrier protein
MDANVESRVRDVIAQTFGLRSDEVNVDVRLGSIPQWDSMGHMELIMKLESEFNLMFPSHAVAELVTVPDIVKAIASSPSK